MNTGSMGNLPVKTAKIDRRLCLLERLSAIVKRKIHKPLRLLMLVAHILVINQVLASVAIVNHEFDDVSSNEGVWSHYQTGEKFDGVNSEGAVQIREGVLAISSYKDEGLNLTGSITFKPSFSIKKGYLEIRARFPRIRKGRQCSVFLQSPSFGNKQIDNNLSAEKTGSVVTIARYASSWGGFVSTDVVWGGWGDKKQLVKGKVPFNLDDGEFHTFGVELTEQKYSFYLNGKKYWEATDGISGVPMYLVAGCEIKKSLGEFDGKASDAAFEIDYVRTFDSYQPQPVAPKGTVVKAEDWDVRNGKANIEFGDFSQDSEFIPSQPGDFEAIRIKLQKDSHLGVDAVFKLPSSAQEAWIQYCLMFANSWQAKVAGKLPGFSANSGRWFGGQGGSPSTGSNAWSARMLYGEYEPKTRTIPLGQYIYHTDQGAISEYGDPDWWTLTESRLVSNSARAKRNHWISIKQHLKVNSADENDGLIEGWIDNELVYQRDNLNLSNSWFHRKITRFWLDVYYGGGPVAESDQLLFIDQVNYSLGNVDNTSSNCQ